MHRVVWKEINAEFDVDLYIANKYVIAALRVQNCQWFCLCKSGC